MLFFFFFLLKQNHESKPLALIKTASKLPTLYRLGQNKKYLKVMGEVGWCDSSTPVKIAILRIYRLPVEKLGLCASNMRLLIFGRGEDSA